MDLCYLRLVQGAVLELTGLTDYAGQPLVFRGPGFLRRCVTRETYNHPYVQRYVAQRMLELEGALPPPATTPAVEIPVMVEAAPAQIIAPQAAVLEESAAPVAELNEAESAEIPPDEMPSSSSTGSTGKKNKRR